MPAPASSDTLDRERVEAALPSEVRASLAVLLATWEVRFPERWPDHPMSELLVMTAVRALVHEYEAEGFKRTAAVARACAHLGLGYEAVERRLRRWQKRYLEAREKRTKCPRREAERAAASR